jgi:hypothetical protein
MRFMMLGFPKIYQPGQVETMPSAEAATVMTKFNHSMGEAGVLVDLNGLYPPSYGAARVSFAGGKPVITDGPFAEAKEVVGGYWIIEVASREEALEWAARCPASGDDVIEVRQVLEHSGKKFMMLMIPGGYQRDEPGAKPEAEVISEMMKYNESLRKAGVLLALDGLHPPTKGSRVSFAGGKPAIVDGPFAEAKEVVGGYWIIRVASREEALDWALRLPASEDDVIEVRQLHEFSDFPPDVQKAAETNFPDLRRFVRAAREGSRS